MAIRANATIRLKFESDKKLITVINALVPEANASATRRANVKVKKDGLFLILTVEADDTVALRATLNAYLRWIGSALNVVEVLEQGAS
jgi:tRNA threonylcarbamoyladenosine modification (KEOPS) complex  Pcc1 subunit